MARAPKTAQPLTVATRTSRAATKVTGSGKGSARGLGRPLGSDSSERRRQIIDAARLCFAASGYAGTTNRAIADLAGITTGAIYHYFSSKLELYLEVFEQTDQLILERYATLMEDPDGTLTDRIEGLLMISTELNAEDESLAAFLALAAFEAHRNAELAETYRAHDKRIAAFLDEMADSAERHGELPAGVDRQEIVDALRVVTLGLTWCSLRLGDPGAHTQVTRAAVRLFRGELQPVKAAPAAGRSSRRR